MVGYIKHNFFVRYGAFQDWAHLNQQAERWLAQEADQRVQGTVKEIVSERFAREQPTLAPLPARRYDTSYHEFRQVSWDCYIDVRGNRYSVPARYAGATVGVHISLDGHLRVDDPLDFRLDKAPIAVHTLQEAQLGWVTVPEHHAALRDHAVQVEQRSLQTYEEAAQWNS